ncbi:hypothetical protein GCM10010965_21570 [Caldalkalibacillus thermarum]|uniref:hypothetical protein n=1 Tax=Caldalkalibacillus thermarum TaxID=296745 RepID=UPI001662A07F|nr:hypothetical protein [Caldalkalibacillus thermarum]GGK28387.1 hypothetical protein GCM10010965_21570 [Caldalkalibacillus thermarum]
MKQGISVVLVLMLGTLAIAGCGQDAVDQAGSSTAAASPPFTIELPEGCELVQESETKWLIMRGDTVQGGIEKVERSHLAQLRGELGHDEAQTPGIYEKETFEGFPVTTHFTREHVKQNNIIQTHHYHYEVEGEPDAMFYFYWHNNGRPISEETDQEIHDIAATFSFSD